MASVRVLWRAFAGCLAVASIAAPSTGAIAQSYPTKPVKLIVGYAAGGVADITARMLAQKLSESLGQQVLVDNRPSAGQVVAAETVAKADPDGYTLLLINGGNAASAALFKTLPYDLERGFAPVSGVGYFSVVLLVNKGSPLNSVADVLALAKSNPGKLNLGSVVIGSTQHLAAEVFKGTSGLPLTIVPFKTTPSLITAVKSNDIQLAFEITAPAIPLIKSGELKALAVTGPRRVAPLGNVPTVMESGMPNYQVTAWNGIAGPAGMPRPIVERLNREIHKVLALPDILKRYDELGMSTIGGSPEQLHKLLLSEIARWKEVIAAAKIEKQ